MPTILVTTLGTSWQIIPELLAFTNPAQVPLYTDSPRAGEINAIRQRFAIESIDEFWMVGTHQGESRIEKENYENLKEWLNLVSGQVPVFFRFFLSEQINDLMSESECHQMSDLIYRVVLHARSATLGGRLYLSLAGGRKTMSADMQQAANIFGCDALIHLTITSPLPEWLKHTTPETWIRPLTDQQAISISPVIISGRIEPSAYLSVAKGISEQEFPMNCQAVENIVPGQLNLYQFLIKRQREAADLMASFHNNLIADSRQQNFLHLYTLPTRLIQQLKSDKIGGDVSLRLSDLTWLAQMPKADLHCHLGGILKPDELLEVAISLHEEVNKARIVHDTFDRWLDKIRALITKNQLTDLVAQVPDVKLIRNLFELPEPMAVCGFILQFLNYEELLKEFIYRDTLINHFQGIGISAYEKLGDLQGSGILQHEKTLRKSLRILKRNCEIERIKYLELRCSPCNYQRGGLSAKKVTQIILDELQQFTIPVKLLFIASRHGSVSRIKEHILLYQSLHQESISEKKLVGFDLAGNEASKSPGQLREAFLPLLEACVRITIHAGEDHPAQSIWEATYHLNADRIGHGLSLQEHPDLLQKFIDKNIAVEMCPSSNDQIVGYQDYLNGNNHCHTRKYPLRDYLDAGVTVTINTDDPGISLTSLTHEFYKAASLTRGGISKWDVLQIIKNGFQSAFCSFAERTDLINQAGTEITAILLNQKI